MNKVIGVPLDPETSAEVLNLSEKYEGLFPAAGIHPRNAVETDEGDLESIFKLFESSRVIAAGEIGVDKHFLNEDTLDDQLSVFRRIMDEAIMRGLPLILHCPRAEPLVFEEVERAGGEKAVFHWYTGPHEILRKILDTEGYFISVTPAVLYSGKLQRIVDLSGLDDILVESDGPVEYRDIGEGEPSHIPMVIEKISEIKDVDRSTVMEATSRNARKLFEV